MVIRSTSYNQHDIIKSILNLHCPENIIDLDATYGNGCFYRDGISEPKYSLDMRKLDYIDVNADCRELPFKDCSFNTIIFDPPFLATKGKSLESDSGNVINKRFGVYSTEKDLFQFYSDSLLDLYRVLNNKGILIFKCQDKISSGKQYLSHVFIINEAERIGFYVKDLFILLAKNRIIAKWQARNQKNARKYHSYFLVLEKSNNRVKYI